MTSHNEDVYREVTLETVLGFTYTDKDGELWAKHPVGGWVWSDSTSSPFATEWANTTAAYRLEALTEEDLWPKSEVEARWGPLVENFLIIYEQP